MTKKKVASSSEAPDPTQRASSRVKSSSAVLGEFLKGTPHYPVLCVNPDYGTQSDDDRWFLILPIEGTMQPVKTEYRGYTPKSDLSSMALAMMMSADRAIDAIADIPVINDLRKVKLIGLAVPQLSS
jgi:hypothetical protein